MAGGNFMGRVIHYVVNQIVVEGLANSPAFQRFAVRTSKQFQDLTEKAVEKKREISELVKDISQNSQKRQ